MRLGTLLAHRKAEALEIAHRQGMPGWAETPHQRPGYASVFKLPRFIHRIKLDGTCIAVVAQCEHGAATEKLTDILHFNMVFSVPILCTHELYLVATAMERLLALRFTYPSV